MAFWGIEVKPKQSHTLRYGDVQGKLVLTQATLGAGSSGKKSILQCEVGDKSPVYLCSLLPEKIESCSLNLEFDEEEDVKFSVVGSTSIHLSGFIQGDNPYSDEEHDVYGEDIAETDSEGSSSDYSEDSEEEYDGDFINDEDMDMFPPSPVRNSGVVIEEIVDDEKPAIENDKTKQPGKKNQRQLVVKGTAGVAVLESEDEDGFPIASSKETASEGDKKKNKKIKNETKDDAILVKNLKRKVDETAAGEEPQSQSTLQQDESVNPSDAPEEIPKKKKKKKAKSGNEIKTETVVEANSAVDDDTQGGEQTLAGEKKKKNKKKKGKGSEDGSVAQKGESDTAVAAEKVSATEVKSKKSKAKPGNVRTFDNGLVIEELEMGKPDGKRASRGKKVSVRYIGKLQKTGKIFDSNIGQPPFKFILGIGQVIKGWDVGVEGMRIGDKRKLTIPPAMAWNATYESLLGSNKPFPQPIPLAEMVDFLVDVWEQEGMYD